MTVSFDRVARKIYDSLVNANYTVALYDGGGNRTFEPELARRFFTLPNRSMVSIHEDGDEKSKIAVALSDGDDIERFEKDVGRKLRLIAAKEGQNMSYDIRAYGKKLSPKDFAHQIKRTNEDSEMNKEKMAEARMRMTGTPRSSYQKVGECKVIVRHSARVNEEKRGARSRNIEAIFVETKMGERFKIPENNIHGARAMARHLSNGGSPFDTVGSKVTRMMEEMSKLRTLMKEVRKVGKQGLEEESSELSSKISNRYCSLRETMKKMSGPVGYFRQYEGLIESQDLSEYGEPNVEGFEDVLNRMGYSRLGGGPVGGIMIFRKFPQGKSTVSLKVHPMSGGVIKWWIDLGTNQVASGRSMEDLASALSRLNESQIDEDLSHEERQLATKLGLPQNIDDWEQEHFDKFKHAKAKQKGVQEAGDETMGFVAPQHKFVNPAHELVFKMQQALEPESDVKLDDEEWVMWSRLSEKLNDLLMNPKSEPLTKQEAVYLKNVADKLGVDLRRKQENVAETDEGTPIEGKITVDSEKTKDELEDRDDQEPEFDRPTGKNKGMYVKDLARDNSEGLHSENYYTYEEKLPEEKMLESWFDSMSNVEFFKEDELQMEEDKAPTARKILPETALHTLNMYMNHPLFNHYITLYNEQEILDKVIEMTTEESKLRNKIVEAKEKLNEGPLVEFDWSAYNPNMIDAAVEKLKHLVGDRRKGMDQAIDELSTEIADAHFNGDEEAKSLLANDMRSRAEEEGLIKHDFGSTFADDALSSNDVVDAHKDEVGAEEFYGDARFHEGHGQMMCNCPHHCPMHSKDEECTCPHNCPIHSANNEEFEEASDRAGSNYAKAKAGGFFKDKVSAFDDMEPETEEHLKNMLRAKGVPENRLDAAVEAYKRRKMEEDETTIIDDLEAWKDDAKDRLRNSENHEELEPILVQELVNNFGMPEDDAYREVEDLENEAGIYDFDDEMPGPDDYSDDAEALASMGWGTDEDYGFYGESVSELQRLCNLAGVKADAMIEALNKRATENSTKIEEVTDEEFEEELDEDSAEKKLGRKAAGSWGRPGSENQKRMASKASRRSGKEEIESELSSDEPKNEEFESNLGRTKKSIEETNEEPELSEDGARIIQIARYKTSH